MIIKPVLRPGKTKNEKRIAISIHDGGKNPTIKMVRGRKINKSQWNERANEDKKNWVRSSHPQFKDINKEINDMLIQCRAEKTGQAPINLINTHKGKYKPFLKFAHDHLNHRRNSATAINVEQAIKKLELYLVEKDNLSLPFTEITNTFVREYYNWLLDKYKPSSANQYLGVFRTIFNNIKNDESNNIETKYEPFKKLKKERKKTKSLPLNKTEFEAFKRYEPKTRTQHIAKNHWLFQYSQAMRFYESNLIKWLDLRYDEDDGKILWHDFTSKSTQRFSRSLEESVVELLLPCIERYDQDIYEVINAINEDLTDYKDSLKELKIKAPTRLTPEDILLKLQQGYDATQMQEDLQEIKDHYEVIKEHEEFIEGHKGMKLHMLGVSINEIRKNHPNDYVWDKPLQEGLDREKIDIKGSEDFKAYKRCLSQNDSCLKRIAETQKIETKISSHTARHTASYFMMKEGKNINEIGKLLNHTNPQTTISYMNRLGLNIEELTQDLANQL